MDQHVWLEAAVSFDIGRLRGFSQERSRFRQQLSGSWPIPQARAELEVDLEYERKEVETR